jgi:hypothetical protein
MRSILFALSAAGLLGTMTGCAEDIAEIQIVQNQPLDAECLATAVGANTFISRGVLDLFVTDTYVISPLVRNNMVASESIRFTGLGGGAGGLQGTNWEANSVNFNRAVAEFEGPSGLGVPIPRSLPLTISGSVIPGGSAAVSLQVVTSTIAGFLRQSDLLNQPGSSFTLLVKLKFFGTTAGGTEVDSNEFVYPITVCNGCLLQYPTEAIDTTFPVPNCRNFSDFDTVTADVPCFPGQDEPLDCRLVCPLVIGDPALDPNGLCSAL